MPKSPAAATDANATARHLLAGALLACAFPALLSGCTGPGRSSGGGPRVVAQFRAAATSSASQSAPGGTATSQSVEAREVDGDSAQWPELERQPALPLYKLADMEVVLVADAIDEAAASDDYAYDADVDVVRRALQPELLTDVTWALGSPVTLYQADGKSCLTTVTAMSYVGLYAVDEGDPDALGGEAIWQLAEAADSTYLALALGPHACPNAKFALPGRARAQPLGAVDVAWQPVLRRALGGLDSYRDLEAEYLRSYEHAPADARPRDDWHEHLAFYMVSVGLRRYVLARAITEGVCAEFGGTVTALWEVTGERTPQLHLRHQSTAPFEPILAFDADGDGIPAFVEPTTVTVPSDATHEGCGC